MGETLPTWVRLQASWRRCGEHRLPAAPSCNGGRGHVKGSLTREFRLQVFFHESGSREPEYFIEIFVHPLKCLKGLDAALIKKKTKFSTYIRKFRWGSGAKSYMRKGFLIYEEMRKFFPIYEGRVQ